MITASTDAGSIIDWTTMPFRREPKAHKAKVSIPSCAVGAAPGQFRYRMHKMKRVTYGVNEVASMLGIGRTTIYKLIDQGRLTCVKVGARTLIHARDVEALLDL
jgi:excisionase family DNA binding protein